MKRIGMVARWKPVHLGHAAVLDSLVKAADTAIVGIGSSNKHDADNPWTAAESADMIRLVTPTVTIVDVPDLGHGPRWREMVRGMFGELDAFVTANAYVRDLMTEVYRVIHPVTLIPAERRIAIDGTMVRAAMASGRDWRSLVPHAVADYLERNGLVARFLREFPSPAGSDP